MLLLKHLSDCSESTVSNNLCPFPFILKYFCIKHEGLLFWAWDFWNTRMHTFTGCGRLHTPTFCLAFLVPNTFWALEPILLRLFFLPFPMTDFSYYWLNTSLPPQAVEAWLHLPSAFMHTNKHAIPLNAAFQTWQKRWTPDRSGIRFGGVLPLPDPWMSSLEEGIIFCGNWLDRMGRLWVLYSATFCTFCFIFLL